MTTRDLLKRIQAHLGPDFEAVGFKFSPNHRGYVRSTDARIFHQVCFEFDRRDRPQFSIFCGINSTLYEPEPLGGQYTQFFAGGGMSFHRRSWKCANAAEADASLAQMKPWLAKALWPWFDTVTTLSALAEKARPADSLAAANLYFADRKYAHAIDCFEEYIRWLETKRKLFGDAEVDARLKTTHAQIEEAKRLAGM